MKNAYSPTLRAFAAQHASRLLHARFESAHESRAPPPDAPVFERWILGYVLAQLTDGDPTVRKTASAVLEKGCSGLQGFTAVLVALMPRVEELLVNENELVLVVLASDAGFELLKVGCLHSKVVLQQ
jgi:hypothetical protein